MSSFSARLSQLRNERTLSQKELAEHLGLGRTTIANYEQDTRFPNPKVLCDIADYFAVSLDYLLGRTDMRLMTTQPLFSQSPCTEDSLGKDKLLSPMATQYLELLLAGDKQEATQLIVEALKKGISIKDVYLYVFERALVHVGNLWESNLISVADEHYFTAATRHIMSELSPYIASAERNGLSVVATAVNGEQHDIGIRMVADFFELDGWDSYYLGANTPTHSIVNVVKRLNPNVLAVSATISLHVESVQMLIKALRACPFAEKLKILVGGHIFNAYPQLWKEVGADGYSVSAEQAVGIAYQLIGTPSGQKSLDPSKEQHSIL